VVIESCNVPVCAVRTSRREFELLRAACIRRAHLKVLFPTFPWRHGHSFSIQTHSASVRPYATPSRFRKPRRSWILSRSHRCMCSTSTRAQGKATSGCRRQKDAPPRDQRPCRCNTPWRPCGLLRQRNKLRNPKRCMGLHVHVHIVKIHGVNCLLGIF
jgi:hypothetical protein